MSGEVIPVEQLHERTLLKAVATELAVLQGSSTALVLELGPVTAFELIGLLQLVLRHPDVGAEVRDTAEAVKAMLAEQFATYPALSHVIRLGDDPDEDRPREEPRRIVLPGES